MISKGEINKMKRKISIILISIIIVLSLLIGCSKEKNLKETLTSADNSAKIAVVADTQSPTNLDIAESWNSWYTSRWGITETLFKLDNNLEPQPLLVENYEMLDSYTWSIRLRDDVVFQNGNKLTGESVKLCWERTQEINARFNELLHIDNIEVDGQVLIIKTSKIVPTFKNALCEPLTGIIDVTTLDDPAILPIGTGPFKVVSYEPKSKAVVEKHSAYWGGEPKLDGAVINIIGDTNTLALAQQNGESHISVSMPSTSLELFSDTSLYNIDGVPGSRGQVIFINFENKFLKEKALRQALSMLIDKESYANVINKGASVPATGLYPDFMEVGASEGYKYDMDAAAAVLDKAGIKDTDGDGIREINGQNISLRLITYNTKAELPNLCNGIASAAKTLGIDIDVEIYESVSEQQKTKDFDLMMVSFTMVPTGDPQYFANIAFKTGGSSNYGGYSNMEVDNLINDLDEEFDNENRIKLAKEIQKLIIDDAAYIVVGHSKYFYIMTSQLKGLHTNPSEYYLLDAKVYLED